MYKIEQCKTEAEFDTFITLEFEAARENSMVDPSKPLDEQMKSHREELTKYIGSKQKTGIFIAKDGNKPVGYVWISERGYQAPWDCQPDPAWVYDLRVDSEQRGKGMGKDLMLQAETWAIENNFERIGLHVFSENQGATILYTKLGYKTLDFQAKKDLDDLMPLPVEDDQYKIRLFQPEKDMEALVALWKENFIALAKSMSDATAELCQERFESFIKKVKFDNPEVETFVVTDEEERLFGFVRLTIGDYHGQQQTYVTGIQVLPGSKTSTAPDLLLGHVENWASQKGSDSVISGSFPKDELFPLLEKAGYQTCSLYMFKPLSGN